MKSAALTLFLFLTLAAFPATAADGPVSGSWTVKGNVYGNDIAQVCTLKQDEKKLTGTCKSDATGEVGITGDSGTEVVSGLTEGQVVVLPDTGTGTTGTFTFPGGGAVVGGLPPGGGAG